MPVPYKILVVLKTKTDSFKAQIGLLHKHDQ